MKNFDTPYYLIDEARLLKNLKIVRYIKEHSGAKVLLALKCFSSTCTFDIMRDYLDGVTTSSANEVRLGCAQFNTASQHRETHSYCVGYTQSDILDITNHIERYGHCNDKIIFNSISQLDRFYPLVKGVAELGVRVNPKFSYSHFDLADPARKLSRLGVSDKQELVKALPRVNGLMFHFNCENDNIDSLDNYIRRIGREYADILERVTWVSLGGGIAFTSKNYPYKLLSELLWEFSKLYGVQVYLEPGSAIVYKAGDLVTTVVDILDRGAPIAIVDASIEAHMLDLLTYRTPAIMGNSGRYQYQIAGRSCLAGDIFGDCRFKQKLCVGDVVHIQNALEYSIVKMNWFNGLQMPSIVIKRQGGRMDKIKTFYFNDFLNVNS